MTAKYVSLLLLVPILSAFSSFRDKPLVIAVLDSGFGYQYRGHEAHLCQYGHKDVTSEQRFTGDYDRAVPIPVDTMAHGTHIVGLIDAQLQGLPNYCIVIIKVFSEYYRFPKVIEGIVYATNIKADIINISGGGFSENAEERQAVGAYLQQGGIIVAAAGNERTNIDRKAYYPASYPGVIAVGNLNTEGYIAQSSNYGKRIDVWEIGEERIAFGLIGGGTSQATAIATGKLARKRLTGDSAYAH